MKWAFLEKKESHLSLLEPIETRKELFMGNIKYRNLICNLIETVTEISENNSFELMLQSSKRLLTSSVLDTRISYSTFSAPCLFILHYAKTAHILRFLFQLSVYRDSLQRLLPKQIYTTIRSGIRTRTICLCRCSWLQTIHTISFLYLHG